MKYLMDRLGVERLFFGRDSKKSPSWRDAIDILTNCGVVSPAVIPILEGARGSIEEYLVRAPYTCIRHPQQSVATGLGTLAQRTLCV